MRYSVGPETDTGNIPADAESVHMVRPTSIGKLGRLIKKCGLKKISLSSSCAARLSARARKLIREMGVELSIESRRGRALGIGLERMRNAIEMHRIDVPYRKIEERTGIPKSTAHYLIKYANRDKVKQGKQVVYLE